MPRKLKYHEFKTTVHNFFSEFEGEDELAAKRITRILTTDLPQYFAIVSRVRIENQLIGEEGGVISSKVVPQVQAVFPQGALNKKIRVGLQVSLVSYHDNVLIKPLNTKGESVGLCPKVCRENFIHCL